MIINRTFAAVAAPLLFSLAAGGCGSVSVPGTLWPFGSEKNLELSRVPANSTTYQCAGGKRFYVRVLDNGAAAWVILPEREFRLDRVAGEATRYGNGKAVLTVNGEEVSLVDGPTVSYTGCRIPAAAPTRAEEPAQKQ